MGIKNLVLTYEENEISAQILKSLENEVGDFNEKSST